VLAHLSIKHLRNISSVSLVPHEKINLLLGDNGSGKTTILEAIHLLGLGRSFRTRTLKQLVQFEQQQCQVISKIVEHQTPIGLQYDLSTGLAIRLNNAPLKKLSDLAQQLPIQYIPANSHQFFEQGPKYRRQLLDWGLFHVEPSFNFHWQTYKKVIQQRNSALRQRKKNDEIKLWDHQLVLHGEKINQFRLTRLNKLLTAFSIVFPRLCPEFKDSEFTLKYKSGWPKDSSLEKTIAETLERDKQLGYTRSGSHGADWSFKINGHDPHEVFSRGQQKLFFIALCMSQIQTTKHAQSLLLIDDISSELDRVHQQKVLQELLLLPVQTFITSTDKRLQELFENETDFSSFHVKQGELDLPK